MKLTSKSLLAINAVIDLVLLGREAPVAKSAIAERHKISISYLDQIFMRLRSAGVIASVRGPTGGYRVTRPLSTVTLAEIVLAIEGEPERSRPGRPPVLDDTQRLAGEIWKIIGMHVANYLATISLADVIGLGPQLGLAAPAPAPAIEAPARRKTARRASATPQETKKTAQSKRTKPSGRPRLAANRNKARSAD